MARHSRFVVVLGLVALGQCRPSPVESQAPAESGEAPLHEGGSNEGVRFEMDEHFMDVSAIRDAIVDGDLATVAELSELLIERESEATHPDDWKPHVDDVVAAAKGLRAAKDLQAAAVAAARLGGSCGACHGDLEVHPPFDDAVEPADDDSDAAQMQRHQWAMERMWEGIVGPSDWAWTKGTASLDTAPGCPEGTDREICRQLAELGARATDATDHETRIDAYGALLGTCAACHAAAKD